MDMLVGNQRLTTVGNITPTGTALRIYSVDAHATTSFGALTFHNGLKSSTTLTLYLHLMSDTQGGIHESWKHGVYFPDGVWINTTAAGTITTIVGYNSVKA